MDVGMGVVLWVGVDSLNPDALTIHLQQQQCHGDRI